MAWFICFVALGVIGAVGALVSFNRVRFDRSVRTEVSALLGSAAVGGRAVTSQRELPAPAARYRDRAVGDRAPVRTLRMRHGGTFCTSPGAKPLDIRGEQYFTADPPGFVWSGSVSMGRGLWIDARDMYAGGHGSMRVLLDDTIRLADAKGPATDRAAALRLLAELPWLPTALFDARYVEWSPIDATRARATLKLDGMEASCVFEFGEDGLPVRAIAERPLDSGELRPWGGEYRDWRRAGGMLVPFEAEVSWRLETGPFTYAHWLIESFEFD